MVPKILGGRATLDPCHGRVNAHFAELEQVLVRQRDEFEKRDEPGNVAENVNRSR